MLQERLFLLGKNVKIR